MTLSNKRIVITGIGVVSPIGIGKDAFWQALREGKSGIKPITLFDTSDFNVKVGGEITEFDAKDYLGPKVSRNLDRATRLLCSATKLALDDANFDLSKVNLNAVGLSVGTTFGSVQSISDFDKKAINDGPLTVNPSHFPNTVINSPASQTAIRFGIKGFNTTISTGLCASHDALEYSVDFLKLGKFPQIISGSVEEMCLQTFLGLYKLNLLSGSGAKSTPVSCPFDNRRNGLVFSEGSAVFVLETFEHAQSRGANLYAEIRGIGSCFDPERWFKFNPRGHGMQDAMKMALENAGLGPHDIDCIFANANSTKDADTYEALSIYSVFGHDNKVPITAIKSMLGETFSASGGMALAAAIGAVQQGFIPSTINLSEDGGTLNYIKKATQARIRNVMINSFDWRGGCSSVIVGSLN